MLISCNRLKKYIKNPEDIDFQNIWDDFTLRVAEVEGVTVKGNDMDNVVTAQITEVVRHPESDKLSLLKSTPIGVSLGSSKIPSWSVPIPSSSTAHIIPSAG